MLKMKPSFSFSLLFSTPILLLLSPFATATRPRGSTATEGRRDVGSPDPIDLSYFTAVGVTTEIPNTGPTAVTVRVAETESTILARATGTTQVNKYLGVPYAKPPRRWELASLPEPETTITPRWKAGEFGDACFQSFGNPANELSRAVFGQNLAPGESEDCLSLNIYVPAGAETDGGNRPVMFAIHGGAFQQGTSSMADFSQMAGEQDIIVVSINYRLNIFGFATPFDPSYFNITLNLGLHDQQLALDWTKKYIHQFGGDGSHIVLWGMSAGAQSVDALLVKNTNPEVVGAIMQSGHMSKGNLGKLSPFQASSQQAWNWILQFFNSNNCPLNQDKATLSDCIRNTDIISAQDLRESIRDAKDTRWLPDLELAVSTFPIADGVTIKNSLGDLPGRLRDRGEFHGVPVLSGTSSQEARFLLAVGSPISEGGNWSEDDYNRFEQSSFNGTGVPILEDQWEIYRNHYNENGNSKPFDRATALVTDSGWTCTQRQVANIGTVGPQNVKNWRYVFDVDTTAAYGPEYSFLGAFHGSDSLLMFDNGAATRNFDANHREIARKMRALWGNFVRNPEAGPGWPNIAAKADDPVMVFGDDGFVQSTSEVVDRGCALFDELFELYKPSVGEWDVSSG